MQSSTAEMLTLIKIFVNGNSIFHQFIAIIFDNVSPELVTVTLCLQPQGPFPVSPQPPN